MSVHCMARAQPIGTSGGGLETSVRRETLSCVEDKQGRRPASRRGSGTLARTVSKARQDGSPVGLVIPYTSVPGLQGEHGVKEKEGSERVCKRT